jgi:hypothetical protein
MVKPTKLHSVGTIATVVIAVLLLSASILIGWLAVRSRSALNAPSTTNPASTAAVSTGSGPAAVQLDGQDLTPSSHMQVSAAGFASKEQLALSVVDAQGVTYDAGTIVAGADGKVASSVATPNGLATGDYQLVVVGNTSHRRATVPFRMHDTPPTLTLGSYYGTPGQTVKFIGHGFFASEPVDVYLGSSKTPLASATANEIGAVTGTFTIPSMAAGNYTLTLIGKSSHVPAASGFGVLGFNAWVVLNRYAVTQGEGIGFIAHGFAPGEQVFVYVNSMQGDPAMRLTADGDGRVVVQDTWVPSATAGDNDLTLVGQSSKATATAKFTILPGAGAADQPTPTPPGP